MKNKLLITVIIGILIFTNNIKLVSAHPGRTASDGCHYCRTNCDYWGVEWNVRHCHNEEASASGVPKETTAKTEVTTEVNNAPEEDISTSSDEEVIGSTAEETNSDELATDTKSDEEASTSDTVIGTIILFAGGYGIYRLIKKDK